MPAKTLTLILSLWQRERRALELDGFMLSSACRLAIGDPRDAVRRLAPLAGMCLAPKAQH
jgi:hypothetical protein